MKQTCLLVALIFYAFCSLGQAVPAHTVILILENKAYEEIIGNPAAPYINSLIANTHTALLTQSYAITHPSQPNYILFFSGSNQGVVDNNIPSNMPFTAPNLGASIINKGLTFTGYSESLPFTGSNDSISAAGYARKHNPWVNWQGSSINGIPATSNKPLADFPSNYNLLSSLSIVVPNINNDMHDGSVTTGDTWIMNNLGGYIEWCVNNNSMFILTFDEDNSLSGNHIATFFTGANVRGGNYNQTVTHHNILRTLEEIYQLPYAGASTDSISVQGIFLSGFPNTYIFTGNGNWNEAANWANNFAPPAKLSPGDEIKIDHLTGGQCTRQGEYKLVPGAKLTVMPGKRLVVQ